MMMRRMEAQKQQATDRTRVIVRNKAEVLQYFSSL